MERQNHGFIYENDVIKRFNLTKSSDYTSEFDAKDNNDVKYQIKCIKKGSSIDLGDIFRNSNKESDFVLIIGFWEKNKKNVVEEYKLKIDISIWKNWFSGFDFNLFTNLLNSISNDTKDDLKWKSNCKSVKNEWNKKERVIQPRFKRDHKKQKRVQCAINNKDFFNVCLKRFEIWQN
jgi:hypothetical protein